jgi:DNA-binding response OmpR family regulator
VHYTVLIIDDDEATHDVLGEYLRLSGYRVLHANNGLEGLAQLREHLPDLALLDVQMPELDGFQTLEQVRKDRQLTDIPILMLTSLNRYNLKVKGLEMGADDYITKPFNRAEILARIKVALRRSNRFSRNNSAMSGDLATISLAELLQTMELGKRSCSIALPDIPAKMYMELGVVVRIEQGRFDGQSAMQRIMFLERGRFEVTMDDPPVERSEEPVTVNALLLSSLTYLDELIRIAGPLLENSCSVDLISSEAKLSTNLSGWLPLPLKDFLCLLEGDLKQNTEVVLQGISDNLILLSDDVVG